MLLGSLCAVVLFVLHVPKTLHRGPAHEIPDLCDEIKHMLEGNEGPENLGQQLSAFRLDCGPLRWVRTIT
jgi:hypothetical protein